MSDKKVTRYGPFIRRTGLGKGVVSAYMEPFCNGEFIRYSDHLEYIINGQGNGDDIAAKDKLLVEAREGALKDHQVREINNELTKMLKAKFNIKAQCLRELVVEATKKALDRLNQK